MPPLRPFLLCLASALVLALPAPTSAQKTIEGRVVDAATGEGLPAAGLLVEGTLRGTITNDDGAYAITLERLPATLVVRYIGYETQRLEITADSEARQDVRLEPATLLLDEVVVTGEDPAENIMRKVIEQKQAWRDSLQTYRAEAYNRFTLANDTGIVSINEALTAVFWDRERGTREVVKARRQTENQDLDAFLPAAFFITNLYDDDVEIAGYELIGVTHPDALRHYAFRLDSTRALDGQTVYDIAVRPANRFKSAFEGRVAVLDSAYALLEVELTPSEAFLFPPPINELSVTYAQQFSNFGTGEVWLPVDFRSRTDLQVGFAGLLQIPAIRVEQVARLSDYDVNAPVPDSLFTGEADELAVDTAAVEADTLLDLPSAAVPLSAREAEAYAEIDSTETLEEAFRPSGPLARFVDVDGDDEEEGDGNGGGPDLPDWLDVEPLLWFNRVEAAHVGLAADVRLPGRGTATVRGGYQTGPRTWTYGAGTRWPFGENGRLALSADYRYGTEPRYASDVYGRFLNSAAVLLGEVDYFDYVGAERVRFTADVRPRRPDVRLGLGLNVERYFSVAQTTGYDLLAGRDFRPNPDVREGRLRSVGASLAWGDDAPLGIIGRRRLELDVEHGPDGFLGSDFSFTRVEAALDWRFTTLLPRRLLPNTLDVRLVGGALRGRPPLQRLGIVDGTLSVYAPFGGLRTLAGRPYEGERHAALFWEHNFRTLPFELVGLYGLARRGYNVLVFGGHARTWVSDAGLAAFAPYAPRVPDGFHHEIGASLSGLFGLLRLNLGVRLDEPGVSFGLSAARIF